MIDKEYRSFFDEVVSIIQSHRLVAVQSVQSISNQLYWHIGELILEKQKKFAWGKSVVEQLSLDLTAQLGGEVSWSTRNLWFMRQLVAEYTEQLQKIEENGKRNQLGSQLDISFLKQLVSEIPEFVAKLDFYLQLVDEQLKQPDDQPSIGILLVPHKEHLEVEYALRTVGKPIGVAQYQLSKQLPKELQGKLPTMEDFKKINFKEDQI